MYDMPQKVKDWLMASRSHSPSPNRPPHNSNAAFIDKMYGIMHQAQVNTVGDLKVTSNGYEEVSKSVDVLLHI